ncbi:hypothetical protein BBB51_04705 [Aggregatibacter aphrophilus]|nr:hypothetical protein BBB51_04705 [Aggregatibacter aphrophilus]
MAAAFISMQEKKLIVTSVRLFFIIKSKEFIKARDSFLYSLLYIVKILGHLKIFFLFFIEPQK